MHDPVFMSLGQRARGLRYSFPPLWRVRERAAEMKEGALRALLPSRMNLVPYAWPLRPEVCPCDVHLCDYLEEREIRKKALFHFGTGAHHVVGLRNHEDGLENEIFAITASRGEHARYVQHVVRAPQLGKHYKVLFGDIYDLGSASLPVFDVVTLFHLCEFTPPRDRGRRMDDAAVLELFLAKLTRGGRVLFYERSSAYRRARPLIDRALADRRMSIDERYKSLLVCRVNTEKEPS